MKWGAMRRLTFDGEASPMAANVPSLVRTSARTMADWPFSLVGNCTISVFTERSPSS